MSPAPAPALGRVPTGRHRAKVARGVDVVTIGGATLKWYDLAEAAAPVAPALRARARADLAAAARGGEVALDEGELGFVILHRCGGAFSFLLVCTWRHGNELWETVWARDGAAAPGFGPFPADGPHRPTFCVWELGIVDHERRAWTRWLRSGQDDAARAAYLADRCAGEV